MKYSHDVLLLTIVFCFSSATYGETWNISPKENVNWGKVEDGDVICLSGLRTGTFVIEKNIVLDGGCNSKSLAILNGAVLPKWEKTDEGWRTVERYPLHHARYASWVLVNAQLKSLKEAGIYRKGEYFHSKYEPIDIKIPKYYSAIMAKGTDGLIIKNLNIRYYHTHGLRISNSKNTVIDNVDVSWIGGGINPSGFPRAGDGITFDGNTSRTLVKNSRVSQCFDTGFTMQLFKDSIEYVNDFIFDNVYVDRCGAGLSVAVHKKNHSKIHNIDITGVFTNLGYGWSGIDNNVHGRGVMVKQFDTSKITNVRLHDSIIDIFSWVGVLQYSGELDAWNNIIKNGTGTYIANRYTKPAAYTAHGMDYTKKSSDDEAIGSFRNNKIINNNGYAFQVINNRPKSSTRQLTIRDNLVSGNNETVNIQSSSETLH